MAELPADYERVRDVLAHELLMAFGINIQDYQTDVANVIMEKLWPEILRVGTHDGNGDADA